MSIRAPPTLLELAAKRLLRDQASAIAALEHLPAELFPYLFAMTYPGGRRLQLLKALAQAWPFTVLPLGVLMRRPPDHAPTRAAGLKAVFDALDVLLAQEVRPRRGNCRCWI
ncbi:Putative PRAME family member 24 [Myotis davidii]|uniref:Putative PRAME family member 24 n=1 Tax=Myotis davidii TaxID=225400 RepID=L5MEJ6_MYODS|nr:Putative PRAME family member 24 [Myotis davidii]